MKDVLFELFAKNDKDFIAACLLRAADQVDVYDNGSNLNRDPRINEFVSTEQMSAYWMLTLFTLIDYMDISTGDIRRLANGISNYSQDPLWR